MKNRFSLKIANLVGVISLVGITTSSYAAPILMSPDWGKSACDAWNTNLTLTNDLAGDAWITNNGGKGYKIAQIYRSDCGDTPSTELRLANQNGKAMCIYGGTVESTHLDKEVDYILFAKTKNWERMGAGKDGPVKALTFGRLNLTGPKIEAVRNVGAFAAFLKLTGEVKGDTSACPPQRS